MIEDVPIVKKAWCPFCKKKTECKEDWFFTIVTIRCTSCKACGPWHTDGNMAWMLWQDIGEADKTSIPLHRKEKTK